MQALNIYDGRALKAFVEQEIPRWQALREHLYEAGDPRWLALAEQERRFWTMVIVLEQQLHRLTVRVWSIVAMLQADDPAHQAVGTTLLAEFVGLPRLPEEVWRELCCRARGAHLTPKDYLRHLVLPQALLLVCGSLHVPRRIQLGPHGQGRMLDAEGRWTPRAPVERLSFLVLSLFIVCEVPKALRCILTDSSYPKPTVDAWEGHVSLSSMFEHRLLGLENRVPSPGPLLGPSPETLLIQQQEEERQRTAIEHLKQLASPQQRDILYGLSLGLTPSEIAHALGMTRQAVNTQIRRLREKGEHEGVFDFA